MTKEEILEAIAGMSVVEVVELVAAMEEKFGVSGLCLRRFESFPLHHSWFVYDQGGHRIMVLTQAFQACDAGSIPAARSMFYFK